MDVMFLYVLLAVAFLLFLVSLISFMTGNENVITVVCMMISAVMLWRLGNACIDGTLTKLNEVTNTMEIVREATASSVFHWIGAVMFIAFIIQILSVLKNSKALPEE